MKITSISAQQNSQNRVNISVDGKYRLSLDIAQVGELGIGVGDDVSESQLVVFEEESSFGKLYMRALEYALIRPRSQKEMRDYLWRKTLMTHYRSKKTGEVKERPGASQSVANRVFERLIGKGYIDDSKFARFWVENRSMKKGVSQKRLRLELAQKGVTSPIVNEVLLSSGRTDQEELKKLIHKKAHRYSDQRKLVQYLASQGFNYDDIREQLDSTT